MLVFVKHVHFNFAFVYICLVDEVSTLYFDEMIEYSVLYLD